MCSRRQWPGQVGFGFPSFWFILYVYCLCCRYQLENPGFDFSGATIDKKYDDLPGMMLPQDLSHIGNTAWDFGDQHVLMKLVYWKCSTSCGPRIVRKNEKDHHAVFVLLTASGYTYLLGPWSTEWKRIFFLNMVDNLTAFQEICTILSWLLLRKNSNWLLIS